MRIILLITCFLAVFIAEAQESSEKFRKLQAIQGTWSMQTKRGTVYETWIKSGENLLLGKSYKVINSDTMLLEQVQLQLQGDDIFIFLWYKTKIITNPFDFDLFP